MPHDGMMRLVFLVLLSETLAAAGQVLMKRGANMAGAHNLRRIGAHIPFLRDVLSKPSLWLGFCAMTVSLVVWLIALAQGDLSLVFSLGSMQYILILILSRLFLNEEIDMMKVAGTLLVAFGIALMTIS